MTDIYPRIYFNEGEIPRIRVTHESFRVSKLVDKNYYLSRYSHFLKRIHGERSEKWIIKVRGQFTENNSIFHIDGSFQKIRWQQMIKDLDEAGIDYELVDSFGHEVKVIES